MQGHGFAGNLTDAPEVATTTSGKKVARMTVAVSTGFRDKTGEWRQGAPLFVRVQSWGDAETAESWDKGTPVVVVGHWRADDFTDGEGQKRHAQWFHAEAIAARPRVSPVPDASAQPAPTPTASSDEDSADDDPFFKAAR